MIETLGGLASTAIVALLSAWVGVWFSLKRYRNEKWWEKKADAYERIINALHATKTFNDKHLDAAVEGKGVSEEVDKKIRAAAAQGHEEILRSIDLGAFLLAEATVARLRQFAAEVNTVSSESESWDEYLDRDWTITNACLNDVITLAKRDLKID